ncbi:methyltransferase TRM13 [Cooperia oncophora]
MIYSKSRSAVFDENITIFVLCFGAVAAKVIRSFILCTDVDFVEQISQSAKATNRLIVGHMSRSELVLWDWIYMGPIALMLNQNFFFVGSRLLVRLVNLHCTHIFWATMSNLEKIQKRCAFVLPKKGRNCRMLTREGQKYCGEHANFQEDNEDRIPCPNDPKHTVGSSCTSAASSESRFFFEFSSCPMRKCNRSRCNSRIVEEQWIVKDVNAMVGETKFTAKIDRRPSEEEIARTIEKLQRCYSSICHELAVDQAHCVEVDEHLEQACNLSESKRKHLIQQSSIIGHLERVGLLRNDSSACILELGAGKAHLAYWMMKRAPLSKFLLVDRSGARNKYDNRALQENPSLNIKRLRCSIEHLNLAEVEMLKDVSNLCAVCKHFCGTATDAGIRCLSNGMRSGLSLDGFVLVPCCHHKSRYVEYSGREFLALWNMDSEGDFAALRHIATWAVCGFGKVNAVRESGADVSTIDQHTHESVGEDGAMDHNERQPFIKSSSLENGTGDAVMTPWYVPMVLPFSIMLDDTNFMKQLERFERPQVEI